MVYGLITVLRRRAFTTHAGDLWLQCLVDSTRTTALVVLLMLAGGWMFSIAFTPEAQAMFSIFKYTIPLNAIIAFILMGLVIFWGSLFKGPFSPFLYFSIVAPFAVEFVKAGSLAVPILYLIHNLGQQRQAWDPAESYAAWISGFLKTDPVEIFKKVVPYFFIIYVAVSIVYSVMYYII